MKSFRDALRPRALHSLTGVGFEFRITILMRRGNPNTVRDRSLPSIQLHICAHITIADRKTIFSSACKWRPCTGAADSV